MNDEKRLQDILSAISSIEQHLVSDYETLQSDE